MSNLSMSLNGGYKIPENSLPLDLHSDAQLLSTCVTEQIRVMVCEMEEQQSADKCVIQSLYGTLYLSEMVKNLIDELAPEPKPEPSK